MYSIRMKPRAHPAGINIVQKAGPRLLMVAVLLVLLSAMWAGLLRLGWAWPVLLPRLPMAHGPLMVSGFLGSLISLERAVALQKRWAYLAPLLSALGGVSLAAGLPLQAGQALLVLGGAAFVAVLVTIYRRQAAPYTLLLALGGTALLGGNLLWLIGRPAPLNFLWWAGFLILTIAGERLELGRIRRLSRQVERILVGLAGLYLVALILTLFEYGTGVRLSGLAMLGMAAWLLRFDIARLTVRKPGLPRFSGISLLSGYIWLGFAGILALIFGGVTAGLHYDALLHSIFLGFTISMVFGHAPIILPAIRMQASGTNRDELAKTGQISIYHPALYLTLALLHSSLGMRVIGDLLVNMSMRKWGGLLNVITILLFLAMLASRLVPRKHRAKFKIPESPSR